MLGSFFVNTLFASLIFLGSAPEARPAGYLFILSSVAGMLGAAVYTPLIPFAALGIFFAVCGITLICLARPDWVLNGL